MLTALLETGYKRKAASQELSDCVAHTGLSTSQNVVNYIAVLHIFFPFKLAVGNKGILF